MRACSFPPRHAAHPPTGPHVRGRAPSGAAALRALGRGARGAVRGRGARRVRGRGRRHRLVPRAHLERAHLRAGHRAGRRRRGVRLRLLHARARGRPGNRLLRDGRLHRGDGRAEPGLDARPVRRGDRPVARDRGPARRGDAGLGGGAGAERRGRHRRSSAPRRPTSASSSTTASRSCRSTPTPATTSRSASTAPAAPSWPASRCTRTSKEAGTGPSRRLRQRR